MLPFSVVLLQQIHCYAIWLLRYHGNATNSLLQNRNYYVTMEMQYTHCYTTGTVTLLWKCNMIHRSCYQGKPSMSQYVFMYVCECVCVSACLFLFPPPNNFARCTCILHFLLQPWRQSPFFPEGGVGQTQAWMPAYVSTLRIPQKTWFWRETVEWYTDRGKPKNSEKNLSQQHFFHHKSRMDWPGREPGTPRWEAGD
jgi:hypothetical protein